MQRGLILALLSAVAIGATASGPRTKAAAVQAPRVVVVVGATHLPVSVAYAPWAGGHARTTPKAPGSPTVPSPGAVRHDGAQASALASDGIPTTALLAYRDAAQRELTLVPKCGLSWPLLAGIGRVESDHGRFAGAVLRTNGVSTPRIIGIRLDGHGTARILDTDHGRLDGDAVYDRAVGPMQFIPSTWAGYGVDGNDDRIVDPFNVFDATAAAAHYLCAAGGDLTTLAGQQRAVRAYNNSDAYVALVLRLEGVYARGVPGLTVPILPTGPTAPTPRATIPPANPGPPLGLAKHAPKEPTPTGSTSTAPRASPSDTSCAPASATTTTSDSPGTSPSARTTGPTTDPTASSTGSTSAAAPASSSPAGTPISTSPGAPRTC